ncbi:MAG TPA: metallophosphoesterase [Thermoanaerobaculia bacterium]|nr:metallophosphoesterase [Thermoanaerobaculia bacterium]
MKRSFAMLVSVAAMCVPLCAAAQDMKLPVMENTVRFLVIGDAGTGDREQNEVAAQIVRWYKEFPFTFALMLGDNIYGKERPQDFARKFERPYKRLLDAGVKFHAALGNHDDPNQRYYKPFNLDGKRYRTFKEGNVRFFILDSNYLDPEQVQWLEKELDDSGSEWKIVYFHHPLYTTARRGPEVELRAILEPLFVKHGVDVVFTGHEHIYERFKPQRGIHHFVVGGAAKLRRGDTRRGPLTAAAFDRDRSFMIVAIVDNKMFFQVVSRGGAVVDEGILTNRETADATQAAVMPLVRSP